jgi:hypothetical protein
MGAGFEEIISSLSAERTRPVPENAVCVRFYFQVVQIKSAKTEKFILTK